jgi:hypothetical protein
MAFDAFISYSNEDKAIADAACATLEGLGIRCWIAPRDVPPGSQWAAAIINAIDHCRIMVLVFSSHANVSNQIHREVERSVSKGIPIIPLRIEDVSPSSSMEYFLGSIHWLDALTPPLEKHLQRLGQTVKSFLDVVRNGGDALARSGTAVHAGISPNAVSKVQAPPGGVPAGPRSRWLPAPRWAGVVVLCLLIAGGGAGLYVKFVHGPKRNPIAETVVPPVEKKITAEPPAQQQSSTTPAQPAAAPTAVAPAPAQQPSTTPAQPAAAPAPQPTPAATAAQQPNGPPAAPDARRFDGTWIGTLTCKSTPSGLPGFSFEIVGNVSNGVFHSQRGPEGKPGSQTFDGTIVPDGSAVISQTGLSGDSKKDPFHRPLGTGFHSVYIGSFDGSHGQLTRPDRASCTIDFSTLTAIEHSVGRSSPATPR